MGDLQLLVLLLVPMAGVALIALRFPPRLVAMVASGATFVMALRMGWDYAVRCWSVWAVEPPLSALDRFGYVLRIQWIDLGPLFGVVDLFLGVDGVSMPLVVLAALVTFAAVLVSPRGIDRPGLFYGCLLAASSGAVGAFASLDLFFFFLFHELALIPSFLMLGIWGHGPRRVHVAFQMVVYLLVGSMVLLAGIVGLVMAMPEASRTTNLLVMRDVFLHQPPAVEVQWQVFGLLLFGFGILVGLFPFHTWAPRTYAAAPAPLAMLHAGVLKKFGIYGLLRVAEPFLPAGAAGWSDVLLVLIACNILGLGWAAVAQRTFADMLGYSSVMHMGYLFLGVLAATHASATGVVALMVAHGLSTAGLFAVNGIVQDRAGTTAFASVGGVAKEIPFLGFAATVFAMAAVGLPGLANFWGETLILFGAWKMYPWAVAAGVFGLVISAVYMLRGTRAVFFGPAGEAKLSRPFLRVGEAIALALLMLGLLVLGLVPALVTDSAAANVAAWAGPAKGGAR